MCHLVEALLLGIQEHLPELGVQAEVSTLQQFGRSASEAQELVTLCVTFSPEAILGEFATRSRVALSVRVATTLRFSLLSPLADPREEPLRLRVDGLAFPALPEAELIRRRIKAELGPGPDQISAFNWWQEHKHREYPAETSKFHRVVESLLEMRSVKSLGAQMSAGAFWGYLYNTGMEVEAFDFDFDPRVRGGVAVSLEPRPPVGQEDEADREKGFQAASKLLAQNRSLADRLAPSGTNMGALVLAKRSGLPGARPEVITKLLSAAHWWGPGADGWHCLDNTWECTDRRDPLGRLVEAQGRVIWRLQSGRGGGGGPAGSAGGGLRSAAGGAARAASAGRITALLLWLLVLSASLAVAFWL